MSTAFTWLLWIAGAGVAMYVLGMVVAFVIAAWVMCSTWKDMK